MPLLSITLRVSILSTFAVLVSCSSPESEIDPIPPAGSGSSSVEFDLEKTLQVTVDGFLQGDMAKHAEGLSQISTSKDARLGWILSDLIRVSRGGSYVRFVVTEAEKLLDIQIDRRDPWNSLTNHLIAANTPAIPNYREWKSKLYVAVVPQWQRLMSDSGDIDWRLVSWGGVGIDDRPYGKTHLPVNSIPAVDNPKYTDAEGGTWLDDDAPIFGVEINGEARAYPRFIMEIREMANDTLGGRHFAMPYCTLCGSAQVWFTDRVPEDVERPVLRTSGLLIRSNKLMYDVVSGSVFDTFLGNATNGSLHKKEIQLPGHTVVSSTWGEWKQAHPDTTLVAEEEALGKKSDLRKTRDANGPIFPIGNVDPRLSVQEEVLGVISPSGKPVAFPVAEALKALESGKAVSLDGIALRQDSGGLVAVDQDGALLVAHEAFWFGWSQFRPSTAVWREK